MAKKQKATEEDGQYLKALCAMKENDISVKILKPLLEAMGWERVEFYGGPHERGIDLIAQRKLPPRADHYVLVAQTKKTAGLSSHETSRLIHQLRQACTAVINAKPGVRAIPDEVYLACPERISTRLLDELASQLTSLVPRIHIYDGPQIIRDIRQHKVDLLNELGSIHDRLVSLDASNLRNQELLDALSSQSAAEIQNFYSDLSFFVGSIDSNFLLHLEAGAGLPTVFAQPSAWPSLRLQIERMEEKYGVCLSVRSVFAIEESFGRESKAFHAPENRRNSEALKKARYAAEETHITIGNGVREIENRYASAKGKADPRLPEILEILDFTALIKGSLHAKPPFHEPPQPSANLQPLPTFLQPLLEQVTELARLNERVAKLEQVVLEEPTYRIEYAFPAVNQTITSRIASYFKSLGRIDKHEMSAPELRLFLRDTLGTLGLIAQLERDPTELRKCIEFRHNSLVQDRISISPHDVFDSRENIAVYGGAGVGKTTTLKAYIERSFHAGRRDIIYVPLNKIVDKLVRIGQSFHSARTVAAPSLSGRRGNAENSEIALTNWLSDRLLAKVILISRGLRYEEAEVAEAQALLTSGVTLILDGLDEAFDTVPQLVEAIIDLNRNNRETQLIVSSRDCVSYLRNIDFLGITLLPFTPEQLSKFIRGWFNNSEKSEKLVRAIEERDLYEHMRTPLLATIACALMEKGIEAHTNEREIYAERIRLLTGIYDTHKQIRRQSQPSELLQRVARRIAYEMHRQRVRSLPKEALTAIASDAFVDSHEPDLIQTCVIELINPCNILVLDSSISEYSFGHFRFQEHLAAEELRAKGRSELVDRLSNDWWRGALCLYAQDADIHELFEETYRARGNIRSAERTLREMIANAPKRKRNDLQELFEKYMNADEVDELLMAIDEPMDDDEGAYESHVNNDKWW